MKTCAIIIPTYDCVEFIPTLMYGLKTQLPLDGWRYEIRIGVDGCKKTHDAFGKIKQPVYYSDVNVGHGIMRTSLFAIGGADMYAYFDADDVMMPEYMRTNIQECEHHGFVMCQKFNTDENLRIISTPRIEDGGAMVFTPNVLDAVGGFSYHRVAVDTDFMRRWEMAGGSIHRVETPLYLRRKHRKALTCAAKTRIRSQYRKTQWQEMTETRARGVVKINPVTVPLVKCG